MYNFLKVIFVIIFNAAKEKNRSEHGKSMKVRSI